MEKYKIMNKENTPEAKARFFAPFMVDGSTFTLTKESYYDTSDPREGMGIGVKNPGFTFEFNWNITPNAFRYGNGEFPYKFIERSAVELTPLSQIHPSHLMIIGHLIGNYTVPRVAEYHGKLWVKRFQGAEYGNGPDNNYRPYISQQIVDFLRSRGYYVGDGTEIEYGWVKLSS